MTFDNEPIFIPERDDDVLEYLQQLKAEMLELKRIIALARMTKPNNREHIYNLHLKNLNRHTIKKL